MDWLSQPPDSWTAKGGLATIAIALIRILYWLWRRRTGAGLPLFGWIGRHFELEITNITQGIENRTLRARVARLEAEIRNRVSKLEAEIRDAETRSQSESPAGTDSLFVWPGEMPTRSKRGSTQPSETTPESSDGHPGSSDGSGTR